MPRLGYLATCEDEFLDRLGYLMDVARDSLEIKRKILEDFTAQDCTPTPSSTCRT
jgi:ribonucleoside-triphosphate reductase